MYETIFFFGLFILFNRITKSLSFPSMSQQRIDSTSPEVRIHNILLFSFFVLDTVLLIILLSTIGPGFILVVSHVAVVIEIWFGRESRVWRTVVPR